MRALTRNAVGPALNLEQRPSLLEGPLLAGCLFLCLVCHMVHMVVVVWSVWSCVSVCACVCKPEIRVVRAAGPRSQIGWRSRDESCRVGGARPFATSRPLALPSGVCGEGKGGQRRSGMRPHTHYIKCEEQSKAEGRGQAQCRASPLSLSLSPAT